MANSPTARVDKLLSSMGYGSRTEMARLAKAGGITLDAVELVDVTQRIRVTSDLPSRMEIDGAALDPVAGMVILLHKPLGMTCSHKEDFMTSENPSPCSKHEDEQEAERVLPLICPGTYNGPQL